MPNIDFAAVHAKIAPTFQKVERISDSVAMVTATFPNNPKTLDASLLTHTKGKLSVSPGTVRPVEGVPHTYRFGVISARDSMEASEDNMKVHGLTPTAPNSYIDQGAKMWDLVGDETGKRLVRRIQDDVSSVIRGQRSLVASSFQSGVEKTSRPENGAFVSYLHGTSGEMRFGYFLNAEKPIVIDMKGPEVEVSYAQIIDEVCDLDADATIKMTDMERRMEVAELDLPRFIAYIRRIYGYHGAFCEKYIAAIRNISSTHNNYWTNAAPPAAAA